MKNTVRFRENLLNWAGEPRAKLRRLGLAFSHGDVAQEADRLRYQLRHDETTGLPNRLFLKERLETALDSPEVLRHLSLLVIDLDRFKPVNELYGKEAGDFLLRQAALRLQNLITAADKAARIGGDKFAILHYAEALPDSAIALAEQAVESLGEAFIVDGHPVMLGASAGIALCPQAGAMAEAILQDAETALHYARELGGGQACLFKAEMRRRQNSRRQLEQDFRLGLEAGQFTVHYQPLFECDNSILCGFEALVRWQHPLRGMVGPAEFIPFAERSGLITRLGLWVLETACAQAAHWPDHLRISVNISPVQLRAGDLIETISAALEKAGLPAHRLELEVTEGALIENPEQACAILRRLKEMGVQIAIDDFGTGYSSLNYLRHFPFDRIKIDRSFIQNLHGDADALAIVRAIIDLGHSLRIGVLAEGIETETQLRLLCDQNCDQMQGYLLGRPAPLASAAALVDRHSKAAARRLSPKLPL